MSRPRMFRAFAFAAVVSAFLSTSAVAIPTPPRPATSPHIELAQTIIIFRSARRWDRPRFHRFRPWRARPFWGPPPFWDAPRYALLPPPREYDLRPAPPPQPGIELPSPYRTKEAPEKRRREHTEP